MTPKWAIARQGRSVREMFLNDMRADLWKSLGARGDASGGFFEIFFRAISKKKLTITKLYRIFNGV